MYLLTTCVYLSSPEMTYAVLSSTLHPLYGNYNYNLSQDHLHVIRIDINIYK